MEWSEKAGEILARMRAVRPLVHHITNLVVTNLTANTTLAVGASPVMAHAPEEVREMVRLARCLVLNIGTLTPALVESMVAAGQEANRAGVPVVLDPVGAGATSLRTSSAARILAEVKVDVLRGNAAEVAIVGGYEAAVKGVEAAAGPEKPAQVARRVAERLGTVVAATGPVDYVSDGRRTLEVRNGHPLLTAVTGTGCMATTVIGAFRAVEEDGVLAAAAALAYFGYAAELAAARAEGPGSFQVYLLDALHLMRPEELARGARIGEVAV
ncbi:MAG: hydroxyethylthiazole kinase [Desulfotomaculales bacterium]